MKKLNYSIIAILIVLTLSSQGNCQFNLVPNPSFEAFDTCPNSAGQIYRALGWTSPTQTSPDYHHTCTNGNPWNIGVPQNVHGYQNAKDGNGYVGIISYTINSLGIITNFREYIQIELFDTLVTGQEYYVRFFVSPGDSCRFTTNSVGAYFSNMKIDTIIYPFTPLPYSPQIQNSLSNNLNDRNVWKEVSGTFIASGDEKFLILGNFNDTANTILTYNNWDTISLIPFAVHYIDDILVTPLDSLTSLNSQNLHHQEPLISINPNQISISSEFGMIECLIYNGMGQIVYKYSGFRKYLLEIESNNYSQGFYYISIKSQNGSLYNLKLFKP